MHGLLTCTAVITLRTGFLRNKKKQKKTNEKLIFTRVIFFVSDQCSKTNDCTMIFGKVLIKSS